MDSSELPPVIIGLPDARMDSSSSSNPSSAQTGPQQQQQQQQPAAAQAGSPLAQSAAANSAQGSLAKQLPGTSAGAADAGGMSTGVHGASYDGADAAAAAAELAASCRFEFLQMLGPGVLLARTIASRSGSRSARVAILQLPRSCLHQQKPLLPQLQQQLQAANSLYHPHVVRLHEVMLSCEHLNVVIDYCSAGSLLQYVQQRGAFAEAFARWFFQQLVLGVDYCHSKRIWGLELHATQLQVGGKTRALQSQGVCMGLPLAGGRATVAIGL
jgi:serine/threonine protein kinase